MDTEESAQLDGAAGRSCACPNRLAEGAILAPINADVMSLVAQTPRTREVIETKGSAKAILASGTREHIEHKQVSENRGEPKKAMTKLMSR